VVICVGEGNMVKILGRVSLMGLTGRMSSGIEEIDIVVISRGKSSILVLIWCASKGEVSNISVMLEGESLTWVMIKFP
jgi:hypothetical protein